MVWYREVTSHNSAVTILNRDQHSDRDDDALLEGNKSDMHSECGTIKNPSQISQRLSLQEVIGNMGYGIVDFPINGIVIN